MSSRSATVFPSFALLVGVLLAGHAPAGEDVEPPKGPVEVGETAVPTITQASPIRASSASR
jgi:hypothetical protein